MQRALGGLLALSALVATGCSDEPSVDARPSTESRLDCAALITDDALTALGWRASAPAVEHAGRCVRRVDDAGGVTVMTRAVTATGEEPSLRLLDRECAELRSAGGYVAQPVDWLEPEREASCATGLADTRTGVAKLYFLNDREEVVQIRVEALAPVPPSRLRAGLAELVAGAATLTG